MSAPWYDALDGRTKAIRQGAASTVHTTGAILEKLKQAVKSRVAS
jgi:hypothetical protein